MPQPDWLIDRQKLAGRFPPRVRAEPEPEPEPESRENGDVAEPPARASGRQAGPQS